MKVKIGKSVFNVRNIDTDNMIVYYTNRNHFRITVEIDECTLLSENSIDDLAIKYVQSINSKKTEEKHTWVDGSDCNSKNLDGVNLVYDVKTVGGITFRSDGAISQTITDKKEDVVNNPKHYQIGLGEYEMKDVSYALIDHNKLDGREGAVYFNILKYIGRFNNKGVPIQDLEKAEFYLKELIELTKEKDY